MRIYVGATLLALVGLSGCGRDFAIPELGADIVPPTLASLEVTPAAAGDGATLTITLEATEALPATSIEGAQNPLVELLDAAGETATATCTGEGTVRSCTLVVDGTIAEGTAGILVTLEDAAGNSSGVLDARRPVQIDRTPPTLLLGITPNPTSRGAQVELEVVSLFELLGALPTIESPILENIACLGIPPTGRFDCTATVMDTQLTEADVVIARAVDLAGNEGSTIEYLGLQDAAPELSELSISQNPVRGGETIVLHTVSNVEVHRCDGTVGGQVAPCTADPAGQIIDCSFVVPSTMSEGAYRAEIVCENFSGFARASGELYVDRSNPAIDPAWVELERVPGGSADALVGAPGAALDPVGTLDYAGRQVIAVRFQSRGQLLAEGAVNADGSFRLPLPAGAGCEEGAVPTGLLVTVEDAAGNVSPPLAPNTVRATLRPGQETCLNSRSQTIVPVAYAGINPIMVSAGHLLAAGSVISDATTLQAIDASSHSTSGDAVDLDVSTAGPITTANAPSARSYHAMAYHPPSGKVVLFGGGSGGTVFDDTWTYDGSDWTQEQPLNRPPARIRHSMVYDPLEGHLWLFGGVDDGGDYHGGLWSWDGNDWSHHGGFSGVSGGDLVYDALHLRVLSVGGIPEVSTASVVRVLGPQGLGDLGSGSGQPTLTTTHGAAFDAAVGRLVVQYPGSADIYDFNPANFIWNAGWTTLALEDPALTYAAAAGQVVSHGGLFGGASANNDFRRLDRLTGWENAASCCGNQYQHALAYDAGRDVVVAFGGAPLGNLTSELTLREARTTTAAHAFVIRRPQVGSQILLNATVTWVGSGSGNSNGDGTPDPWVSFSSFQRPSQWVELASHSELATAPASARTLTLNLDTDVFDDGGAGDPTGDPLWLVARARPSGNSGAGGPSSTVVSDFFELQVVIDR